MKVDVYDPKEHGDVFPLLPGIIISPEHGGFDWYWIGQVAASLERVGLLEIFMVHRQSCPIGLYIGPKPTK